MGSNPPLPDVAAKLSASFSTNADANFRPICEALRYLVGATLEWSFLLDPRSYWESLLIEVSYYIVSFLLYGGAPNIFSRDGLLSDYSAIMPSESLDEKL